MTKTLYLVNQIPDVLGGVDGFAVEGIMVELDEWRAIAFNYAAFLFLPGFGNVWNDEIKAQNGNVQEFACIFEHFFGVWVTFVCAVITRATIIHPDFF